VGDEQGGDAQPPLLLAAGQLMRELVGLRRQPDLLELLAGSVPSFLQAATRPFMPPKAATDVAVAALVELAVLPPLAPPEDELLQPAASTTLLTAAAAMNSFLVGTCVFPSRTAKPPGASGARGS
jgi:hypothetical protein